MIKAIAIDDELPALKVIENFSGKVDFINLERTFVKPREALQYIKENPIDLLFLDINMPSLSGIEFYKAARAGAAYPLAIFTTAHSEYAVEGFNLNVVDYLLKPFTHDRFLQSVVKAKEIIDRRQPLSLPEFLFLRIDYSLVKIAIADILLVEGMDDYLRIHLQSKPPLLARMTMKAILSELPPTRFLRVHRSFIVNTGSILTIRNKTIYLEGREIPIGVSYEKEFFARFPIHR
jgi:DNA-binding LytR/AlgR family response regulator